MTGTTQQTTTGTSANRMHHNNKTRMGMRRYRRHNPLLAGWTQRAGGTMTNRLGRLGRPSTPTVPHHNNEGTTRTWQPPPYHPQPPSRATARGVETGSNEDGDDEERGQATMTTGWRTQTPPLHPSMSDYSGRVTTTGDRVGAGQRQADNNNDDNDSSRDDGSCITTPLLVLCMGV